MGVHHKDFIEIVFQNREKIVQTSGLSGLVIDGLNGHRRADEIITSRMLFLAPLLRERTLPNEIRTRGSKQQTLLVFPKSWTAVYVALDNVGMWNFRTEFWARQYLGQQFYIRVHSPANSIRDEYPLPKNALLCGRASNRHRRDFTP
ncbi:SKU5 similar 10 [Raphanus sativus]|nr:SKU5 similar 10 [Raphanus sativus]